ncbi:hypothetical protein [Lentibacillus sp. JNUCC-1]|uniref:hypothetical protein n=1 Tax=Lentibacillus sp. JNUCC-1 TaxID=2654513 RepID=UPI0012E7CDE0|nr:hypothetical protein [Lentibacillus sp. JNUCC-1]
MSVQHYHQMCRRYKGRAVEVRTKRGQIHRGIIMNVDDRQVFLRPIGANKNLGGFGYGFYRPGYGYSQGGYYNRGGFGFGIALGAIAGLTLLPLFFW